MTKKFEKEFDAVKMMREIREQLQKKYGKNPELRRRKYAAIRKKYKIPERTEEPARR